MIGTLSKYNIFKYTAFESTAGTSKKYIKIKITAVNKNAMRHYLEYFREGSQVLNFSMRANILYPTTLQSSAVQRSMSK